VFDAKIWVRQVYIDKIVIENLQKDYLKMEYKTF